MNESFSTLIVIKNEFNPLVIVSEFGSIVGTDRSGERVIGCLVFIWIFQFGAFFCRQIDEKMPVIIEADIEGLAVGRPGEPTYLKIGLVRYGSDLMGLGIDQENRIVHAPRAFILRETEILMEGDGDGRTIGRDRCMADLSVKKINLARILKGVKGVEIIIGIAEAPQRAVSTRAANSVVRGKNIEAIGSVDIQPDDAITINLWVDKEDLLIRDEAEVLTDRIGDFSSRSPGTGSEGEEGEDQWCEGKATVHNELLLSNHTPTMG